ncbi:MAG: flagellar basal body rod C-terminal domain-containing protein [Gammaproteobacteria bacterium]
MTNDLANLSTVGYKRASQTRPSSAFLNGPGFPSRFQPVVQSRVEFVEIGSGPFQETGESLHVAMNDKTVMSVQAANGDVAFTRRGDMRISPDGFLELSNGLLVLGEGGAPITAPADSLLTIAPDGQVFSSLIQTPDVAPVAIGQLGLRDASGVNLVRRQDGLFEAEGSNGQGGDFATGPNLASVQSGALEGSDANAVEIMVNLLDFYRSFETQMKVIKSIEELDQNGAQMMQVS